MSLGLTRKTDYALLALARLAAEDSDGEAPLSAVRIAEADDTPPALMMNVLKCLHGAGLVESRRGAAGGYWLASPPAKISIAQVIEAIEGPVQLTACCDPQEADPCTACQHTPECSIGASMRQLNGLLIGLLRHVTLEDLMRDRAMDRLRRWMDVQALMAEQAGMNDFGPSIPLALTMSAASAARKEARA